MESNQPSFASALKFWIKLGWISFGGPTGQIAIMHEELVEKRRWISEARFLQALNFCMLLPGPEAQQLSIYIGWLLHKTWGGIVAGVLFVLPSMLILWGLSVGYVMYGNSAAVVAIFAGLKPAVLAIILAAVLRIGKRALKNAAMWLLALLAFVSIHWGLVPFPLIILSVAAIGLLTGKYWPVKMTHGGHSGAALDDHHEAPEHTRFSWSHSIKVLAVCLSLWALPFILIVSFLGTNHTLFHEATFFSKAAMVTFGGAYAVLPYVSQQAVESFQWLTLAQMNDGLGLAETTPGPLIMVLQFVGFLGAWNNPGSLPPLLAATLGALVTTWTTFVPCFLWVFLGAPHNEKLRNNQKLTAALSAVTAAVVGVILNLALLFGESLLFTPAGSFNVFGMVVAVVVFCGITRWKWDVLPVVFGAAFCGWIYWALFAAAFSSR